MKPAMTDEQWREAFDGDLTGKKDPRASDGIFVDYATTPESCHALAAMALHAQPFGFTLDDIATLRTAVELVNGQCVPGDDEDPVTPKLRSITDRIGALLPTVTP